MSDDALDEHIIFHVRKKRAPTRVLWPAFLAMWKRIGNDCATDFIVWAAYGETLFENGRPHTWNAVSDELRDEAREYLVRAGYLPDGQPNQK